ncbi:MAG: hypothetical protein LLG20_24495 [Acidobacteriales bacterium]|nr:hypothetical protein [Terriglobales bacterium]
MITPHEVVQLLPEYDTFAEVKRNQVFQFVDTKLQKLQFKLINSPYAPTQREDTLNVNHNPTHALHEWLAQFPNQYRLGALTCALAVSYITHLEVRQLLDIVFAQFIEHVEDAAKASRWGSYQQLPEYIRGRIRILPLSDFGQFPEFIRRANIAGTTDSTRRPAETLKKYLFDCFEQLRYIADWGENTPYPDQSLKAVSSMTTILLDSFVMVVEDNSFSGTSAASDLRRLAQLTDIIFTPWLQRILATGHSLPKIYLLLPVATAAAVDNIAARLPISDESCFPIPPIVGQTFVPSRDSFASGLPEALHPLQAIVGPEVSLLERVGAALEFFYDTYAHTYWESETAIARRTLVTKEDVVYGYKRGGYAIVSYSNCPNNSLPLLWYPHIGAGNSELKALFPRVESRITHSTQSDRLEENIDCVRKDEHDYLKSYLTEHYARIL